MLENNEKKARTFRDSMGDRLRIAKDNGATYELFSNTPIPQFYKEWLTKKVFRLQKYCFNMKFKEMEAFYGI